MIRVLLCVLVCLFVSGCASVSPRGFQDEGKSKVEQIQFALSTAQSYYEQGALDLAKSEFEKVLALDPSNLTSLYRMGHIAFRTNDFDSAEKFFRKVVAQNPRYEKAYYNLAVLNLIKAEKNLQYYSATTDPETDLKEISLMLKYIGEFAAGNLSKTKFASGEKDELQDLVNLIQHR